MSYTSLDNRVIDAAIAARVCGFRVVESRVWPSDGKPLPKGRKAYKLMDANGSPVGCNSGGFWGWGCHDRPEEAWYGIPAYSTDYNAAHEALGKLSHEQLKLVAYVLMEKAPNAFDARVAWLLVVSPRQICEAILEALDKEAARG